jgi:multidrug efflux pump subunit AcrA (membrane-fusion protein)
MAYDFSAVVNQMRSAGVAQAEIDTFLKEQERLEKEFQSQFDTTKSVAGDQFKAAQAEIEAMFAKEQQSLQEQKAVFEQAQLQSQEQAKALAAQAEQQQKELAKQKAEAEAQFAETSARIKSETEGVQRESAEKTASKRRARRSAGGRDSIINAVMGENAAVPKLGGGTSIGTAGALGADQTLGAG